MKLLRNRRFALIWLGQSVSSFGDWVRNMAITFWVYEISGHSPVATSAVMVAEYLPMLLLAPVAGVFVDRWSRRRTMFWTQLVSAVLSLSFLAALGARSLPLALVIAFLGSLVSQFYNPARGAMLPVIVDRGDLVGANSLSQVTANLALVLGPVVGTSVYFSLGAPWSFALDALSFILSAGATLLARLPENEGLTGTGGLASVASQWREGLAYVRSHRTVRTVLLVFFVLMLGGGAANVCDLYLVTRNLALPESRLSLVMSVQGLASVAASLGMMTMAARLEAWKLLWIGVAVLGVGAVNIGLAPNLTAVLVWTAVAGVGTALASVGQSTILQTSIPVEFRGRVFGVMGPTIMAGMLTGTAVGGFLARQMDVRPIISATGLLALVAALMAFVGLRGERTEPQTTTASSS
mgnify:CR=1 FL=1